MDGVFGLRGMRTITESGPADVFILSNGAYSPAEVTGDIEHRHFAMHKDIGNRVVILVPACQQFMEVMQMLIATFGCQTFRAFDMPFMLQTEVAAEYGFADFCHASAICAWDFQVGIPYG